LNTLLLLGILRDVRVPPGGNWPTFRIAGNFAKTEAPAGRYHTL
jgi:hypothetical protein